MILLMTAMGTPPWVGIALLLLFTLVLFCFIAIGREQKFVSHWHHYVENMEQTPMEFYELIKERLATHGLPNIKISFQKYSRSGMFSGSRTYLQIWSSGYYYLVCAAPHGNGFFISYWQHESRSESQERCKRIPVVGYFLCALLYPDTFFINDTRIMYQKIVHHSIVGALEQDLKAKGLRAMTELESSMDKNIAFGKRA